MERRRAFVKKAALGSVALSLTSLWNDASSESNETALDSKKHPICYFTKHLQWLDYDDLGLALKEAGFDGADLTIRSVGHIEPDQAGKELPKAFRALEKHRISAPMAVTRISDPNEKGVDELLKVMADNGIKYYRMGYLNYNYDISIEENIRTFNNVLTALAELNAKYGICGAYQNHAGSRLGASIWDLLLALKGIDPDHLGCQFDVRHATYEGGRSWENDFRAIKDHIRTTVVKDFHWYKNEKGVWANKNTLMGDGMVDFEKYFTLYKKLGIEGPISNHSEYPLITKEENKLAKVEKMKIAITRLKQDVEFTKKFLQ